MNVLHQLTANVLITASHYSLVGLAFSVPYLVSRFLNFTVAAPFTVGAYAAWVTLDSVGSLPAALIAAPLAGMLLGLAVYMSVVTPLRRRNASPLVLLVATMGAYAIVHNSVSLAFTDASRYLDAPVLRIVLQIGGARISSGQLWGLGLALATLVSWAAFQKTAVGNRIKAIADDRDLAIITGLNVQRLELLITVVSFGFGGGAGVILALEANVSPGLGLKALFMGVVVSLLAGRWSIPRIGGWSLLLATLQATAGWYLGNEWRQAPAFAVLVVFLVLRSWRSPSLTFKDS